MKKLILLLSLIVSLISLTLKDNAEFKGKVLDDQTGLALFGAQVPHLPSGVSTSTDYYGSFMFSFLPQIGDQLEIKCIGYETKYVRIQSLEDCAISMRPAVNREEAILA
jgi:hypothetical protein